MAVMYFLSMSMFSSVDDYTADSKGTPTHAGTRLVQDCNMLLQGPAGAERRADTSMLRQAGWRNIPATYPHLHQHRPDPPGTAAHNMQRITAVWRTSCSLWLTDINALHQQLQVHWSPVQHDRPDTPCASAPLRIKSRQTQAAHVNSSQARRVAQERSLCARCNTHAPPCRPLQPPHASAAVL